MQLKINFKNHDLRNYIYQATRNLVTGLGMGVLQIYNKCLHETGAKITQTSLKLFRLLDRAD
jgi:hypothetical protein